jgi:hypothetical protein
MTDFGPRTDRFRKGRHNTSFTHRVTVGDELEQDKILSPETARMCMDQLAKVAGELAYTPEIQQIVMSALQMRYEEDIGNDVFVPPNYAPYDDPELATFYGIETNQVSNLQTRKENYDEQRNRLVREVVRQVEPEMKGLYMQMEQFRVEDAARHGVADEQIYTHVDPDITLFRNYSRGWSTMDRPIATSDKSNVINLYEAEPEFTHTLPHAGWETDRRDGFWNKLG